MKNPVLRTVLLVAGGAAGQLAFLTVLAWCWLLATNVPVGQLPDLALAFRNGGYAFLTLNLVQLPGIVGLLAADWWDERRMLRRLALIGR